MAFEFFDWAVVVVGLTKSSAGIRLLWLWAHDAAGRKRAALRNLAGVASDINGSGLLGRLGGRGRLSSGNIEDVQLAAGGLLDTVLLGGVVGYMVSIDDVVVPVSAAELEGMRALEAEGTFP